MYVGKTKVDESRMPALMAAGDRLEIIGLKNAITSYEQDVLTVRNPDVLIGPREDLDIFARDINIPRIVDTVNYPVSPLPRNLSIVKTETNIE